VIDPNALEDLNQDSAVVVQKVQVAPMPPPSPTVVAEGPSKVPAQVVRNGNGWQGLIRGSALM
jgi:hypothetical protein